MVQNTGWSAPLAAPRFTTYGMATRRVPVIRRSCGYGRIQGRNRTAERVPRCAAKRDYVLGRSMVAMPPAHYRRPHYGAWLAGVAYHAGRQARRALFAGLRSGQRGANRLRRRAGGARALNSPEAGADDATVGVTWHGLRAHQNLIIASSGELAEQ